MDQVEGHWTHPPMRGHTHNTLQTIIEVPEPDANPPGIFWMCFVVPAGRCPEPECEVDQLKAGVIGAYVYRRGEPWFCRTVIHSQGDALVFRQEFEYPIDDLPWAVSDGTEATARRKLAAYLIDGGGHRDGLLSEYVGLRDDLRRKLRIAS